MAATTFTTAGRLVQQVQRIADQLATQTNTPYCVHIQTIFGGRASWGRGIAAYIRLVDGLRVDLDFLSQARRTAWDDALSNAEGLVDPQLFPQQSELVLKNRLVPAFIVRLEGLDEALIQAGRGVSVDEARIAELIGEIDDLIAWMKSQPPTAIDSFVVEQLANLREVLLNFALYGPEGAQVAVAAIAGAINLQFGGAVPDPVREKVVRILKLLKRVSDAFVYGHEGAAALLWAAHLAGLLPGTAS